MNKNKKYLYALSQQSMNISSYNNKLKNKEVKVSNWINYSDRYRIKITVIINCWS